MIDNHTFQDKKAVYYTLGCKLNFAETSTLGKFLSEQGIRKATAGETADICIVNTCSVTQLADKKCRQAIRRIKKQHPEAVMVVTGCYAQLKPEEVSAIEGVDLVLGANQKMEVMKYLAGNEKTAVMPVRDIQTFVPSCSSDDRTRHFLKVQDGCDYFCSYCTIPYARGRSRNGRIAELVALAQAAGKEGAREIVLTGVNIGDFGKTTGETFFDLLKALEKAGPVDRFRISSIEPNLLTPEILAFIARSQRFAPHFHIPLQSGSDEVLKLMRRRYDTAFFSRKIEQIQTLMPDTFIGIDVIVGVRGETAERFEATRRFLEALPFSQLHVFTYSERQGTAALEIEPVVSPGEKQERSKQLLELSGRRLRAFYHSQQNTSHRVLFEHTRRGDKMHGFTENYVKTEAGYCPDLINKLVDVTLGGFNEDGTALTLPALKTRIPV
ncbi:MAG: tRNA (N(6)-L-threonylcarbamoyladenosine(37)-C(2))-methylthiotransferase MtaB [Dysgonamonadaceae bacterium]|jgi:threonylcarbamoyladenosine tRNA methylthiotransferase MtaB|nr:tRNA (N(6)-L-threonylcarbamoyladenosine(37)-C(2))-methylthiotransferase MtaB [Dysgonamonadaceae bacterium]